MLRFNALMRFRLAHTLSLTLLAFSGVAVLALGGLMAWQLRHGFGEYLAAGDVLHFERFVAVVEARLEQEDGVADLMAGRLDLRRLLDVLNPRPELRAQAPGRPGLPPPQFGDNPDAFPERIQIVALNGEVLLGLPHIERSGSGAIVERPVHAQGQVVAQARIRPAPLVRSGAEARFLHDQYALMAAGALALIVLALLTATGLARRWTRPLAAVQHATQRLAQGELSVRLPDSPSLAGRSDEIGDVMRNVNRMAEGLQQLEGARRRWLADISHELRTPLTVLRGDIEALHEGVRPLSPQAVAVLHEEVLRLNRLVEDLHLLAISDLQALPCHMVPTDAVALLAGVVSRYQQRAQEAGLTLQLNISSDLPALSVQWDAGRIEQLLSNLLENSMRYTDAPGCITLRVSQAGPLATLVVEDSAPGVPAAMLGRLLEPLYRAEVARDRQPQGSGLGLAICAVIAKAHGGDIRTAASAQGGLCISVTLPLYAGAHSAATGSPA